jgi:molybdopterin-guanine dinucleotide biosynthesis adapter protein
MSIPVWQIVGFKNSGKTTCMEALIHILHEHGYRVFTFKHDAHGFEMDREGTDTWRHRRAGAAGTLIQSAAEAGMTLRPSRFRTLGQWVDLISLLDDVDIVLAEGFKNDHFPKLVCVREWADYEQLSKLSNIRAFLFRHKQDRKRFAELQEQKSGLDSTGARAFYHADTSTLHRWFLEQIES